MEEKTKVKFKISFDKKYRVKVPSKHFEDKYGDANPMIRMLEPVKEVFGSEWHEKMSVPAIMAFMLRVIHDNNKEISYSTPAYYGKIFTNDKNFGIGEIVFKSELEPIK
jgi:hypothetical protein